MDLIDLSLRRPVFAWMLMFSLIVFGAISLNKLGVSQLPDVDFPILSISVSYEGAAPELVESDLIDPIEERLLAIEGIKEMKSSAQQGSARVTLEFGMDRNIDVALQEVQSALSQLRLPAGIDPPVIRKQNPEEDPIVIVSIYGDNNLRAMLDWTNNFLLDQLQFLPGVGEVSIGGFSERNLRVWIDLNKLKANYLTISDVLEAIKSQHTEAAAGQFTQAGRELRVRWLGEAPNIQEFENLRILRRGGQIIHDRDFRLKDVARVEDGLSDIRRVARVFGEPAIAMQIRKQRGTNEIDVVQSVLDKLDQLKEQFPPNYKHMVNINFTRPTEATSKLSMEKLLSAGVITIVICFLFLGSFSAAVNILFSIPTSILGTFTILYFSGFTLNLFTLLALTLAISIVVDDAIMLLENIVRHYRMDKPPKQAAYDGAVEVLPAAVAATLAVIAVFLPVIFMDGIIGKFFLQFGITMSAAVLISLLEAVTITPMRAAALMGKEHKVSKLEHFLDGIFDRLAHAYQNSLRWSLRYRWLVLFSSIGLFAASMLIVSKVRQEFVPAQDQDIIIAQGQTPPGTSLQKTSDAVRPIEKILSEDPDIDRYFVSIGAGGPSAAVNGFFIPIGLKPRADRSVGHLQIMDRLREKFKAVKGLRIQMRDISARNLSSGRQNPVAFNIRGPDLNLLDQKADEIMEKLEAQKFAVDLDKDFKKGLPELEIVPNRLAMAQRGVSIESLGQAISAGVGGLRQGRFTSSGTRFDIRFKIEEDQLKTPEDFKKIYVRNLAGNLIPISELVEFREKKTTQSINRLNRQRAISIFGNLAPGQSQSEVIRAAQDIAKSTLPSGYAIGLEGASQGFAESFKSLTSALLIGIMVAYIILAVQFNSFVHPISVLIALPFSVSGALIALWMFDVSLNLFSYIGLIVLMGIAKKNSILLVEFTNQVRHRMDQSKGVIDSLCEACPVRLRPILMTSVATIAAALPLVLGSGFGQEIRLPMGLTIIGGTIVSTLLTLYVVPSLYAILSKLEIKD